ncbi:ABC transporter permease subunit [Shewanella sp. 6_MG-2023]|uniref:ABC transporter permease subunit n=1 Tax=Shewanella sp. 6_MG-2023 TaxID=3062660 RepID=UPI0026E18E46|nr:ABC transporter permease subunit [Shewanella sp. 6_MG-2023]MDO6618869.1 ABC transporter permease subunit [Shewanella sp. 6_MG-2023]
MDSTQRPSAIRQLWLIASYEVSKRFTNTKGIAALIAFSLIWAIILLYPVNSASSYLLEPATKDLVQGLYGPGTLDQLFNWSVAEFAVFWCIALYLFPFFSIFITADQFSSDKQRGSFRFLSLRVSRDSIFFGRFLGQMLIQSSLLLLTIIATLVMVISRDASLLGDAVISGFAVFLSITIVLLPYTAVMAVLSWYANSARMASIYAVILWALSGIVIAIINSQLPAVSFISWVLPGSQLSLMINTQGIGSLIYAPIPIIQAIVILALGRIYMQRSAL